MQSSSKPSIRNVPPDYCPFGHVFGRDCKLTRRARGPWRWRCECLDAAGNAGALLLVYILAGEVRRRTVDTKREGAA